MRGLERRVGSDTAPEDAPTRRRDMESRPPFPRIGDRNGDLPAGVRPSPARPEGGARVILPRTFHNAAYAGRPGAARVLRRTPKASLGHHSRRGLNSSMQCLPLQRLILLAPALPTFGDERAIGAPFSARHRQDADRARSNGISLPLQSCFIFHLCSWNHSVNCSPVQSFPGRPAQTRSVRASKRPAHFYELILCRILRGATWSDGSRRRASRRHQG